METLKHNAVTHMSYRSLPAEAVFSALRSMMYISYYEQNIKRFMIGLQSYCY